MIPTAMLSTISNAERAVMSGAQDRDYEYLTTTVQLYVICRIRHMGVIMKSAPVRM